MRSRRMCAPSLPCRVTRCRDGAITALLIARSGRYSMIHIFQPRVTNEARLGFNRISISFNPANLLDPTSLGLGVMA